VIIDGRSIPEGSVVATDICIVGGGPAGISLALRLAEKTMRHIVLLESGDLAFDPAIQTLARGETAGMPYYPLHETRVRMLGGSSQSWGGVCTPLDPPSMEERPWVPGGGWPFPAETLDPYLDEALLGCGITSAARAAGEAAHARRRAEWPFDAARIEPVLVHFSRPIRFGTHHRDALASDERIAVHVNSTVTELVAGEGGDGITEVVVRCLEGPTFRVRAAMFVLAGGGVENARLLLASTGRHTNGIGNAHGMVGRCFMEHPRVAHRYRVRPGNTTLGRLVGGGAAGTLRFLRVQTAPEVQRREELLAWHANLYVGYAGQDAPVWPAVRRIAIATRSPWKESPYFQDGGGGRTRLRSSDVGAVLRRPIAGFLGALGAAVGPAPLRRWLEVVGSVEQVANADNRIELTAERDALGVTRARTTWNVNEAEEQTHRRAVELLLAELERIEPGISAGCLDDEDPWPNGIVGTWHHIGATRMSSDPATGVVDADARVHGVDNLYIAGSSVFPVSGSTSPTVTIVQLALRLGDHLTQRLGRKPSLAAPAKVETTH
jgi:choline dehydrogenase-like flavoprotein